jgi:hypothetical protein
MVSQNIVVPRLYIDLYNYLILKEIIMPNGVCWITTRISRRYEVFRKNNELYQIDPSKDVNEEKVYGIERHINNIIEDLDQSIFSARHQ